MGYGIYTDDEGVTHTLPIKVLEDGTQIFSSVFLVAVESFAADDIDEEGVYDVVNSTTLMGISIINNNVENSLTMGIGGVDVVVPAGATVKENFRGFETVTISGSDLDFNAYILNTV
ncbi:MAG: hypothetical protein QHH15_00255 [Candidatus Thermoplasmatota archaeon]|nr:hypothetical protein [Candidatus Thermoplasmatota archaeon]